MKNRSLYFEVSPGGPLISPYVMISPRRGVVIANQLDLFDACENKLLENRFNLVLKLYHYEFQKYF